MPKLSAGLLAYRVSDALEVFLVHPGGPYWRNKDEGAWSVPKGEVAANEDPLVAAFREFAEEVGVPVDGDPIILGSVKQRSGKTVMAWALPADFNAAELKSNLFEMEWPPKSGLTQSFPEVDRGEWFPVAEACRRILPAQAAFIYRLQSVLEKEEG